MYLKQIYSRQEKGEIRLRAQREVSEKSRELKALRLSEANSRTREGTLKMLEREEERREAARRAAEEEKRRTMEEWATQEGELETLPRKMAKSKSSCWMQNQQEQTTIQERS